MSEVDQASSRQKMEIDKNSMMKQINKCQIWDQEFAQMSIEVHIDTFHKQHKCEICERVFKTQNVCKKHFDIMHRNKDKKIMCNICTKTFQDHGSLSSHIKVIHEGHKDYKCESCGKSFTSKYLKTHIHVIHESHKDFKCESCGKSFSEAGSLKKHIHTIHEGHKGRKHLNH